MGRVRRGAWLDPGVVYEGTVAVPSIGTAFRGLATLTTDGLAAFWPTQRILTVVNEHCAELDLRPTDLPGGWPFWARVAEQLVTSTLACDSMLQRGHLYLMEDVPTVYLGPVTKVDDLGAHVGCDGWLRLANRSPGWPRLANRHQGDGVQVWMDHLVDPLTMDDDELVDAVQLRIMSTPWSGAVADDHHALLDGAWFTQHPVLLGRGGVVALDPRVDVERLRALWALSR